MIISDINSHDKRRPRQEITTYFLASYFNTHHRHVTLQLHVNQPTEGCAISTLLKLTTAIPELPLNSVWLIKKENQFAHAAILLIICNLETGSRLHIGIHEY